MKYIKNVETLEELKKPTKVSFEVTPRLWRE